MPNQERGEEQLSVKDMPLVDQYLQCALPVLFIDAEHPAYPGIGGTCFVVRYRDRTLLLTAEHVVRGAAAESIKVPARFNTWLECYSIARIGRAAINDESDPDWLDVAVLVPAGEPEFDPAQVVPLELDIIANLAKVRRKALFAIRGYPRGSGIDYESGIIARDSLAALGFYEGPAPWRACHTLSLSTENLGGPDGLSGSPVVRALRNPDGTWVPALAGMVQRGGPSKVHFVDARVLIGFLEGARLSEA